MQTTTRRIEWTVEGIEEAEKSKWDRLAELAGENNLEWAPIPSARYGQGACECCGTTVSVEEISGSKLCPSCLFELEGIGGE